MKKNNSSRILTFMVFAFLYLPIIVLIVFSFNDSKSRTVWNGFTLHWYKELLHNESILSAFSTTILVSVLAALIATVLGTAAAIGFYHMKRKPRKILMTVNNIPMTNADIITGVSLMLLFVFGFSMLNELLLTLRLGIKLSLGFGTLLIAHITFNTPYVILSVNPKLHQMDKNLSEAAQDLGATPWQAFYKVTLPELWPGIINGMITAFTLSVDDFVISYFTAGSNISTLAMEVYSMTRKRISPEINALSTIMFVTVLALLITINVREIRQEQMRQRQLAALRKDSKGVGR